MLPSASYGVYAAALLALARAVNRELPAPYMVRTPRLLARADGAGRGVPHPSGAGVLPG